MHSNTYIGVMPATYGLTVETENLVIMVFHFLPTSVLPTTILASGNSDLSAKSSFNEVGLYHTTLSPLYTKLSRSNLSFLCSVVHEHGLYNSRFFNPNVINPFPQDKILDQTKLKAFADNKLNVTKMIISVLDRIEIIVGKEVIAYTSNFFFPLNVSKMLFFRPIKRCHCVGMG